MMAYLETIDLKCKNKLCSYQGTSESYNGSRVDLVCPTCGFKTLERYYPALEKIFNESFGPKAPPKIPNDHPRG